MSKTKGFLLAAAAAAMAFTVSCDSGGGNGSGWPLSGGGDAKSSSSEDLQNYCVYPEAGVCFGGSYSACPGGGVVSDICPYSSSSSKTASSSSDAPSSSSVEPSSSGGGAPSSSSVETDNEPSSSSVTPSSSSVAFSSSGAEQSSSSSSVEPGSSGGGVPSSSSVETDNYPSSSSVVPSSSSVVPSSSSALPSSSSEAESSSSVAPSSSSSVPSSSSQEPSSSSQALSTNVLEDSRDGNTYRIVAIGEQIWMAENLNHNATGSKCYDNLDSNCDTYGRLYDWATAMNNCPSGWHLPTKAEWEVMTVYIGGASTEGKKLKATSGWNSYSGIENLDTYGFSALPGGRGGSGGSFGLVGYGGHWWSASEYVSLGAYYRDMYNDSEGANWNGNDKSDLFSVRCVQD